jgi:16S rRNA A1518/A1519 N6-dimethyltransferase RsmA/KsgA/DIM1 with predicted DNA glycosylase/AP lyase activity
MQLWKIAFAHPRKTLLSNLKWSNYTLSRALQELGYNEKVRAEAIKKEDWISLLQQ